MTKNLIPTQAALEPTETERKKIWAGVVARNAERATQGLAERDVALMVEVGLTRHRAQKYQALLRPYLEVCLQGVQTVDGGGPSPADYREAVNKAEAQLRDGTGIVSPKTMMVPKVAGMARHRLC